MSGDVAVKVLIVVIAAWMLYDLTLGWSSARGKRERDERFEAALKRDMERRASEAGE